MEYVMIKEYDWDCSKDKVIIGELTESYIASYTDGTSEKRTITHKISIAYLLEMGDFDKNKEYNIIHNTNSIQIRPKAIYRNDKGYYKKIDGKRIFFSKEETDEIEYTINKFKKYLEESHE